MTNEGTNDSNKQQCSGPKIFFIVVRIFQIRNQNMETDPWIRIQNFGFGSSMRKWLKNMKNWKKKIEKSNIIS